ncbi:hypothetical protein JYU34_015648 [Plutella xylostella]|uniref:Uncharacterized protein n=1 Tax=Plutella xylostella TaxID=51655 RepID=A0ABQ7Q5E5_PLUXY|nr:hypothetical protein JYU34_015648 [Plutella xylostella]
MCFKVMLELYRNMFQFFVHQCLWSYSFLSFHCGGALRAVVILCMLAAVFLATFIAALFLVICWMGFAQIRIPFTNKTVLCEGNELPESISNAIKWGSDSYNQTYKWAHEQSNRTVYTTTGTFKRIFYAAYNIVGSVVYFFYSVFKKIFNVTKDTVALSYETASRVFSAVKTELVKGKNVTVVAVTTAT